MQRACRMVGIEHEVGWRECSNIREHDTIHRTGCLRTMANGRDPLSFRRWVHLAEGEVDLWANGRSDA